MKDLAERIAERLVERHGDVLVGRGMEPGEAMLFRDADAAVLALARDIRVELEAPEPVPIVVKNPGREARRVV